MSKEIQNHISELLYRYDCVIIPGFGGFIANYAPARIHPVQHRFHPPSKKISFNRNLTQNDGLLASHIADEQNISYEEANEVISAFVRMSKSKLEKGKTLSFEGIGSLFNDLGNKLIFEPDNSRNYLLESYGMTSFQALPVKRKKISRPETVSSKKRTQEKNISRKESGKTGIAKYWPAAVALPLVVAALWIPLKTDLLKNINYSGLNPFNEEKKSRFSPVPRNIEAPDFTWDEKEISEKLEQLPDSVMYTKIFVGENETPLTVKVKSRVEYKKAKRNSTDVAPKTASKNMTFHVIGGCFEYRDNAEKLVSSLKRKGFSASIIGKRKGLYTVSYSGSNSRKKALEMLEQAKADNPKAWLLKK